MRVMSPRKHGPSLLAAALLGFAAVHASAAIRLGQERIAGRGTRGPYMLALQNIEGRTEQIFVNGLRLQAGRDYLLDAASGMVSFTEPLRPSDSAEIRYEYDSDKARAPGPTAGTFGLLGGASGGLALTYNFRPDTKGNQSLTDLGFQGQAETGFGALSSMFMVDKTARPQAGREAQGMQFGLKSDEGNLKYNLGYTRVGTEFKPADAMKLLKGSEALNLNASLQMSHGGLLSFRKVDNTTPDAKKGTLESSLTEAGLNLNLSSTSKFTALHQRQSQSQGGTSTESAVDRLQLDQKLGGGATATLIQETVTTGKNGDSETVDATRLNARMTGDHGFNMETGLAFTDSSKKGDARDASVKMQHGAGATKLTLTLTDRRADAGDLRTQALGLATTRGAFKYTASFAGDQTNKANNQTSALGLEGKLNERTNLSAGVAAYSGARKDGTGTRLALAGTGGLGLKYSLSRADEMLETGDKSATNLSLDLSGVNRMKLSASFKDDTIAEKPVEATRINFEANPTDAVKLTAVHNADVNEKGDVATTKVAMEAQAGSNVKINATHDAGHKDNIARAANGLHIEARPSETLKLRASIVDSTEGAVSGLTRGVAMEAQPSQTLKVSAGLTEGTATDGDSAIREAAISIIPDKDRFSLTGSVRAEEKGSKETQVLIAQTKFKPSDSLDFTGALKQRENNAAEAINTVDAKLAVKVADDCLQVIGTFSQNPEEKDKILRLVRRGLTLKSNVGRLTFSGGYITEESLIDDAEGAHAEFKLGLRFNRYAQLSGGYSQTVGAIRGYKPTLAYDMRYDHSIGNDFHLLLEGNVIRRDDPVSAGQRQEVKGTANLGLRF